MKHSWLLYVFSARRLGWLYVGVTLLGLLLMLLECCLSSWTFEGVSWKLLK